MQWQWSTVQQLSQSSNYMSLLILQTLQQTGQLSRYSDSQWDGRIEVQTLLRARGFLFSIRVQIPLGPWETLEKSVSLFFLDGKMAETWPLLPAPFYRRYTSMSSSAPVWSITEKTLPLTSWYALLRFPQNFFPKSTRCSRSYSWSSTHKDEARHTETRHEAFLCWHKVLFATLSTQDMLFPPCLLEGQKH